MYVYVQGRRLPRRTWGEKDLPVWASTPRGQNSTTGCLDELVNTSISLCEGTERNLEHIEDEIRRKNGNGREFPLSALSRPWTGITRDSFVNTQDGGCSTSAGSRPMTGRSTYSRATVQSARGLRARAERYNGRTHEMEQDQVVKMLEERERALVKRTEQLEKNSCQLNDLLRKERKEKEECEKKIKHLETLVHSDTLAHSKSYLKRRYHFALDGDVLDSTFAGKQEMAYFEVKVEKDGHAASAEGIMDSAEGRAHVKRFAYSEKPYEAFLNAYDTAASALDSGIAYTSKVASKFVDPGVVISWLDKAEPRSGADAVPLLILAKDLLRRLVSKEVNWVESKVGELSALVEQLQKELMEARQALAEYDTHKEGELAQVRLEFTDKLAANSVEFRAKFAVCVKKLTPLAFRNVFLKARVQVLLERCRLAERPKSPAEVIHQWDNTTRISALKMLLEMDKVNFWLPEDFAATVKFSESSMMQWSQLFWNHLETEYSGSATMLQVACDVFRANKETLARKIVTWYKAADGSSSSSSLDDAARAALSPEHVSLLPPPEILKMRTDLLDGRRDIWDIAAQILQVPKENAMAELLGFAPEDEEMVMQLWPDFLAFFHQQQIRQLLVDPSSLPLVTATLSRLKASSMWPQVEQRAAMAQYGLFNVTALPPAGELALEEVSRLIIDVYTQRAAEDDRRLAELPLPHFLRHSQVKMHDLRSVAHKYSARFQAAVLKYAETNTRVFVFSKLAGMTCTPLEDYYPCCERFLVSFWQQLIAADSGGRFALREMHKWLPSAGCGGEAAAGAARCGDASDEVTSAEDTHSSHTHTHIPHPPLRTGPISKSQKTGGTAAATGVALDIWYRMLRQYRAHVAELWSQSARQWDNGANLSSPDLAQLRLFLGQACNLAFEEHDLVELFVDMSSCDDTIEVQHGVDCIARRLHRARPINRELHHYFRLD